MSKGTFKDINKFYKYFKYRIPILILFIGNNK